MYYVYRPIDMWHLPSKEYIVIAKVLTEPKLGMVAASLPEEDKCYQDPIEAARAALSIQKSWCVDNPNKKPINILVGDDLIDADDGLLLKTRFASKLMKWANNEYIHLSKCKACRKILTEQGYSDGVQVNDGLCSVDCRNQSTKEELDRLNDNEETEFFL